MGRSFGFRKKKKVFTMGQIAQFCQTAARTVTRWFDSGLLKGYRIPGGVDRRVPRQNLIDFLKKHNMPFEGVAQEGWVQILLVGIDRHFNDRLQEMLPEDDDFKFETAHSIFEAGMHVHQFRPEVVVIDLALGRSEALQIVESLQRNKTLERPFIVGLAGEDEPSLTALIDYGFNEVFQKPFDSALLAERIRSCADPSKHLV